MKPIRVLVQIGNTRAVVVEDCATMLAGPIGARMLQGMIRQAACAAGRDDLAEPGTCERCGECTPPSAVRCGRCVAMEQAGGCGAVADAGASVDAPRPPATQ